MQNSFNNYAAKVFIRFAKYFILLPGPCFRYLAAFTRNYILIGLADPGIVLLNITVTDNKELMKLISGYACISIDLTGGIKTCRARACYTGIGRAIQ